MSCLLSVGRSSTGELSSGRFGGSDHLTDKRFPQLMGRIGSDRTTGRAVFRPRSVASCPFVVLYVLLIVI
jgi:hypothetical protein